jgi:excisionase family DNA binding protein
VATAADKPSTVNQALANRRSVSYEPLIDEKQAAQFLGGLHPKTVQRMARRGGLPHCRVGKYYRFRASELDAWIQINSRGQINPSASTRKEIS